MIKITMTSQKLAKQLLSQHEQISFQKVRLPVLLICKSVQSLQWANDGHFVKSKAKATFTIRQQCSIQDYLSNAYQTPVHQSS